MALFNTDVIDLLNNVFSIITKLVVPHKKNITVVADKRGRLIAK